MRRRRLTTRAVTGQDTVLDGSVVADSPVPHAAADGSSPSMAVRVYRTAKLDTEDMTAVTDEAVRIPLPGTISEWP